MPEGLELYDLEDDVGAFTVTLPRTRVIPIDRFDPGRCWIEFHGLVVESVKVSVRL